MKIALLFIFISIVFDFPDSSRNIKTWIKEIEPKYKIESEKENINLNLKNQPDDLNIRLNIANIQISFKDSLLTDSLFMYQYQLIEDNKIIRMQTLGLIILCLIIIF
jgi:hypothetical protein